MAIIDEIARQRSTEKQKRKNNVGRLIRKLAAIGQEEKNNAESLMSHMSQSDLRKKQLKYSSTNFCTKSKQFCRC